MEEDFPTILPMTDMFTFSLANRRSCNPFWPVWIHNQVFSALCLKSWTFASCLVFRAKPTLKYLPIYIELTFHSWSFIPLTYLLVKLQIQAPMEKDDWILAFLIFKNKSLAYLWHWVISRSVTRSVRWWAFAPHLHTHQFHPCFLSPQCDWPWNTWQSPPSTELNVLLISVSG
jgi:hypothetical protein